MTSPLDPKATPEPGQPVPVDMPGGDPHDLVVHAPGTVGMDGEVEIVDDPTPGA